MQVLGNAARRVVITTTILATLVSFAGKLSAAQLPRTILFGVAYYDEYTPVDRIDKDAKMMKAAGITVVRIAESTWGTLEPQPGVFNFTHVDRMLNAMHRQGISVIVGTPTYAIPTWLAHDHPNVLAITPAGRSEYGPRRNMDITDPDYRQAAERVIVALIDHVKDNPAVIGYQVDNETKSYDTSGPNVQAAFVAAMKRRFASLDDLNTAFGLNYWSNRINRWEDFPSVNGSINASLTNAFLEFRRGLVADFLAWQTQLVRSHARNDQFITHNFELEWRGYSYGLTSELNQWEASKPLDIAGIDIYHPSQGKLTGTEIALGGDIARSLHNGQNYLVMETQAQGFPQWTPYPGQLRLQAFSHLASGANMISYWHWATTANAAETYWRGLLGQDYEPNAVYEEARTIGSDLGRLGPKLVNMRKHNRVAIFVSNTAMVGFNSFKIDDGETSKGYNDVLRVFYDALYHMNVEVDILSPSSTTDFSQYKLIVVPALYAASDLQIAKLNAYAHSGGHLLYTFKSGFSDENTTVRYDTQPGGIASAAGVKYQQFTIPDGVSLEGDPYGVGPDENKARWWMEFLKPTTATVVARYKHSSWPDYAAMTRNSYGKGQVTYLGFMPSAVLTDKILRDEAQRAGVDIPAAGFPVIVRGGTLNDGHHVSYYLNYSATSQGVIVNPGTELLSGTKISHPSQITLPSWGVAIVEGSLMDKGN